MKRELIPSWEELEAHKKTVPEINPAAVIAMLEIKQASDEVQASILDVLQKEYHLSEGKFCLLIVLHQNPQGIAPSEIAAKIGVSKATISNMLMRMERDGMIVTKPSPERCQGQDRLSDGAGTGFHERDLAAALPARHEAHGTPE